MDRFTVEESSRLKLYSLFDKDGNEVKIEDITDEEVEKLTKADENPDAPVEMIDMGVTTGELWDAAATKELLKTDWVDIAPDEEMDETE